jgi:hypothetical protein
MAAVSNALGGSQRKLLEAAGAQQQAALKAQQDAQNSQREMVDDQGQKTERALFMQKRIATRGRGLLAYTGIGGNEMLGGGS